MPPIPPTLPDGRCRSWFSLPCLLSLLLIPAPAPAASATPLPAQIRSGDGGSTSTHALGALESALGGAGCPVSVTPLGAGHPPTDSVRLLFDHAPLEAATPPAPGFRPLAQALAADGETTLRGAWVVPAAAGITALTTLANEPLAFVAPPSPSGHAAPRQLLARAGVTPQEWSIIQADDHLGALSLMIHGDAFAAAMAEPVARQWAEVNRLTILAVTEPVTTGGWWIHTSLPSDLATTCALALSRLTPAQRKALPDWIEGFAPRPQP